MEHIIKEPAELKPAHAKILENFGKLPDEAEVPVQVVAALKSVAPVTIWRWVKAGHIPAPIKRGGVTRWRVGALRPLLGS